MSRSLLTVTALISTVNRLIKEQPDSEVYKKAKFLLDEALKECNYIERDMDGEIRFASFTKPLENKLKGAIITGESQGEEHFKIIEVHSECDRFFYTETGRIFKECFIRFNNEDSEKKLSNILKERAIERAKVNQTFYIEQL